MTDSMKHAIGETDRRRSIQEAYNEEHGITPASIVKSIDEVMSSVYERDYVTVPTDIDGFRTQGELDAHIATLQTQMKAAAANLEFEKAAQLRDRIKQLRSRELGLAGSRSLIVAIPPGELAQGGAARSAGYVRMLGQVRRAGCVSRPFYYRDVIEQFDVIGIGSLTVVLLTGHVHRDGARAAVRHHAGPVRRALDGRPSRQRLDGQGAGTGADRADGRRARRLGHRGGTRLDDGDRSDRRARGRSGPIPIRKLVVPRILAGLIMVPILTWSRRRSAWSAAGSSPSACCRVASSVYWNSVVQGLYIQDVWMGLIKPFFLGFAIVSIGCHVGLRTTGGTQGVGRATTNAVVASSVAVIAVDYLVTQVLIVLMY